MNLLLFLLSLIVIFVNGFEFHGLEGCESTEVPRTLYDGKLGTMFYSFKMDEKNGIFVVEGDDGEQYVKIPTHKHLYGWFYRNYNAFEKEDLGIVDWLMMKNVLPLPGVTFELIGAENLMSIYQDGWYTEKEFDQAIKKGEEIKEKFGDQPYDFATENDLERKTKLNEHFMGTQLNKQIVLALFDYEQMMTVKAMPGNVPDNEPHRKILKEKAPYNTMENTGNFNKTASNCFHVAGEIEQGKRIVTLTDDGYFKFMLNQKNLVLKGETMFAPADVLDMFLGEVYFQINEKTNSLEITTEFFAGLQMKTNEIPIKPKFMMGLPHTETDNRMNFISKESTTPFCNLVNEIQDLPIDYRYLWVPHDELCPIEMKEEIINGFLPKFILGNPETFPTGEKLTELMENWSKLSYCSTDYFAPWIQYVDAYSTILSPIVFTHFIMELEASTEIETAMDQRWSNFWNIDYTYGQEEETISVVHGNYGGYGHCKPGRECWNGEGPCTSDADCKPGFDMYCYKRSQTNDGDLPGYDFTHVAKDLDLCVKTVDCGSSIVGLDANGGASCVGNTNFEGDQCTSNCNSGYNGASAEYLCDTTGDWVAVTTALSCVGNECICTNGNEVTVGDPDCTASGSEKCSSCHSGYELNQGSCQKLTCNEHEILAVDNECFCAGGTEPCAVDNFCYNAVCQPEAKYQGCLANYYHGLNHECVCGTQTTSCGSEKFCYDGGCEDSAKCSVRNHQMKNAFYGAHLTGNWDAQNRRMSLILPVTSDFTIISVAWNKAQDIHALAYSSTNAGLWKLDTSDSCDTKYQLDVTQGQFFGQGSRFTLNGTHMRTVLKVTATEHVVQQVGIHKYSYDRTIEDDVPLLVTLVKRMAVHATFKIRFKTTTSTPPKPPLPLQTNIELLVPYSDISSQKDLFLEECTAKYGGGIVTCSSLTEAQTKQKTSRRMLGSSVNGNAVVGFTGPQEQIDKIIQRIEDEGYQTPNFGPYTAVVMTTTSPPLTHDEFVFLLDAKNNFADDDTKTVSMTLEVHSRGCLDHSLDDGGVRVKEESKKYLDESVANTTFVWKKNADGAIISDMQFDLCVETLTWTFAPKGYVEGTYDVAIQYSLKGGLGTFTSDAEIKLEAADVLADIGFETEAKMYEDLECTKESEFFSLGQKFWVKIVLSEMVVDAQTITCETMKISQTHGNDEQITDMKETRYNFNENSGDENTIICGAELESSHFHVTVDGYVTNLDIGLLVGYKMGTQSDTRRRLRIPVSQKVMDVNEIANGMSEAKESLRTRNGEPAEKSVSIEFEIIDAGESSIGSSFENSSTGFSIGRSVVYIGLFSSICTFYWIMKKNKGDEYMPLMEMEMEL